MRVHSLFKVLPALICPCYLMLIPLILSAQQAEFPFESISLQDLSAFQTTAANWRGRAGASTEGKKTGNLRTQDGTGVLVNLPDDKNKGNLFTKLEHGDIDLDLEFLMAEHSNSGIYLQGRYELQLLDSWGKKHPGFGDCGGIYERWNDAMPAGRQGYEGAAPRLNAARAPGLWQHLYISFQAPRFDAAGKKVENARFLKVELNGTLIHENVELTGPTRGPASDNEAPLGPIMIQGDHGAVAFRNIRYRNFTDKPLQWKTLDYQVAHGPYGVMPEKSQTAIV